LYVRELSEEGIRHGFCLDNRPTPPLADPAPAKEAR